MTNDPRYKGRGWSEVESDLRTGYPSWSKSRGYRDDPSAWDRMKEDVRQAWEDTRR